MCGHANGCAACHGGEHLSPILQLAPGQGCAGDRCIECGRADQLSAHLLSDPSRGIDIVAEGGLEGRNTVYHLLCDPTAAPDAPPSVVAPRRRS